MVTKVKETPVKKVPNGNKSRRKGHGAEREIVKEMKLLGWGDAATTRASSRQLDNAKVDINFVPLNIQSKAVILNMKFSDYVTLLEEVNEGISKLPAELRYRNSYPTIVFHKKDRKTLCIMTKEDLYTLLKYYNLNKTNINV